MSYSRFRLLSQLFGLPRYGDSEDPFDGIRRVVDGWNQNMHELFFPGSGITVDESMVMWKGMGMPGLMVVPRRPTPVGRKAHTLCDNKTGIMMGWEPYEL